MPLKKDYTNYTVEDFICDEEFIDWINTDSSESNLQKLIEAYPAKSDDIKEAREILQFMSEPDGVEHKLVEEKVWNKINQSIDKKAHVKSPRINWFIAASIAASFVLLLWVTNGNDQMININTPATETSSIILADESIIITNENSSLRYDEVAYNQKDRQIQLDGEAFFQVASGKQFIVNTPYGTVSVLGTSFNVYARNGELKVRCYTGKVKVTDILNQSATITAGESTITENSKLIKARHDASLLQPEWSKFFYNYENTSLDQIVRDIENHYNITTVLAADLNDKEVNAKLKFNALDETVKAITWPLNLKYTIKNDTLSIYED